MASLSRKIRHAFAIDPPGPAVPKAEEQPPVDWLCRFAARKHMTGPALVALELCRPLSWVAAQGMHLGAPAVWAVAPGEVFRRYQSLAGFLEKRGAIEYMIRCVERCDEQLAAPPPAESATPDEAEEAHGDHRS